MIAEFVGTELRVRAESPEEWRRLAETLGFTADHLSAGAGYRLVGFNHFQDDRWVAIYPTIRG